MALTCQIPLQEFLDKMHKYEVSLGPISAPNRSSTRSIGRKSQWALFMSGKVAKLRTAVGAKVLSINLLLATHTSESISRLEAQAQESHVTLLASVLEQGMSLKNIRDEMSTVQDSVKEYAKEQVQYTNNVMAKVEDAATTLDRVSESTESVHATVMSFRCLGIQLMQMIHDLPVQVREVLEQVVRTNVEIYHMLRAIQDSILRSPASQPGNSIHFEDVLGRSKTLPYEYFRYIEVCSHARYLFT
ncbi:hypothetical protein K469DRAFT_14220 [Zopfia rhizophila CBS 207.26]|uniref:Fungal N-terminal domain-containing protein n=1 Tax=Zopfia rhizophila CBS 207.26 TaxID=1314779 RepID=A0A6A6EVD2_9PEZI|nr:hypothetical protein K469DRAFT_14220 [Zopfia rhizophila CBS 207.26]